MNYVYLFTMADPDDTTDPFAVLAESNDGDDLDYNRIETLFSRASPSRGGLIGMGCPQIEANTFLRPRGAHRSEDGQL